VEVSLFIAKWTGVLGNIFIVRQHILLCYSAVLAVTDSVCPSVCLSVCPSVTVRYHVKMTQATIMRSSVEDSHITPVTLMLF